MVCQECGARKTEGALYCAFCGTPFAEQPEQAEQPQALQTHLLNPAPVQPPQGGVTRLGLLKRGPRRRRLLKGCLMVPAALFALVIGCAGLSAIFEDGSDHTAAAERAALLEVIGDEREEDGADRSVPEKQVAFIETVESFSERYEEAENDLQSSAQRAQRRTALAKLLPDRSVKNWTGTLESLDTDTRGNAYITIEPDGAESITIATWNNALADAETHSMIRSDSELYEKLAEMREGERVRFSGTFAGSEQDHLAEGSLTEDDAMTTPDFVMIFSDVDEQE